MDALHREAWHLHWEGVTEGYLRELEQWAGEGQIDADQLVRYPALQALVAQYRPTLAALLAE
jgi:hypothetical protein